MVKSLLKNKQIDSSIRNNCAIYWASANGHYKIVKLLLKDKWVDPSVNDNLQFNGHLEMDITKLLNYY